MITPPSPPTSEAQTFEPQGLLLAVGERMSPDTLLVLPLLLPLITAACCFGLYRSPRAQQALSLTSSLIAVAVSFLLFSRVSADGVLASAIGGWAPPFGIALVADLFSAVMVVITAVIGFVTAIYSLSYRECFASRFGFHPLLHTLLLGVTGAFLTGDIFNLYVWFEVLLMASFVLLALGGTKAQLEGALKYVTINLLSSALFLAAAGILYGMVGTLNMADLALRIRATEPSGALTAVAGLFMVAFGLKAAVVPLFFWLPASYHTPPTPIAALFAGLLTKVGVYALIRVFTLIFVTDVAATHTVLLWVAGATMLVGVLGAMIQNGFKKVLSMHIVSQIGYMIMGLALYAPLAVAGAVFYIIHHIIVKTNLFLIAGLVEKRFGTTSLKKIGNLYATAPFLAVLFIIPAFSLAGIPPLSGFFPKLVLVRSGLEEEQYIIVAVSLFVSLCTLFSMIKLWSEAFLKEAPQEPSQQRTTAFPLPMLAGVVMLATITVWISVSPGYFFALSERIAAQLMTPTAYLNALPLASVQGGS